MLGMAANFRCGELAFGRVQQLAHCSLLGVGGEGLASGHGGQSAVKTYRDGVICTGKGELQGNS